MKKFDKGKVVVIIPIYKPDNKFLSLLDMLHKQKNVDFEVCIVDSLSDPDFYMEYLEKLSYRIVKTTPKDFNHGGTRQNAADQYKDYPFLVYMTQDAIPVNEYSIYNLLKVFENSDVGCAYGRQLPHKNATILAARARAFNYPAESKLKSMKNSSRLGIKTPFISNTFAAYRHEVLDQVGGFPTHVILSEDTYVAAKMVLSGWTNAYCADAQVFHSHNYTIMQEFKRYFDTGVFHSREPWIRNSFGQAEGEGLRFVISELKYLLKHKPFIVPEMVLRDGAKFIGYKLGTNESRLSLQFKRKISMMPSYWKEDNQ